MIKNNCGASAVLTTCVDTADALLLSGRWDGADVRLPQRGQSSPVESPRSPVVEVIHKPYAAAEAMVRA